MEKIIIIDYGLGNLRSIVKALNYLSKEVKITNNPDEIKNASKLILPGVGAFKDGMSGLKSRGLIKPIKDYIKSGKPILGICLGMQLLMTESEEFGLHKGLNFIPGKVVKLKDIKKVDEEGYKVPHIGWSQLDIIKKDSIFSNIPNKSEFYFVHSFYVKPNNKEYTTSVTMYGKQEICASIQKDNVFGCQFHPEMSGSLGLEIYKNFCKLNS